MQPGWERNVYVERLHVSAGTEIGPARLLIEINLILVKGIPDSPGVRDPGRGGFFTFGSLSSTLDFPSARDYNLGCTIYKLGAANTPGGSWLCQWPSRPSSDRRVCVWEEYLWLLQQHPGLAQRQGLQGPAQLHVLDAAALLDFRVLELLRVVEQHQHDGLHCSLQTQIPMT